MSDQDELEPDARHPVLIGLLALVGVGLAVGLVLGVAALAGTKMLGIGENGAGGAETSQAQDSMYLPRPEKTRSPSGPLITLSPDPSRPAGKPQRSSEPSSSPSQSRISLAAGQTAVAPMEQIDLTGVYPGGEGAILQVQRFTGGRWEDFPVTASVSNETFTTYVQTGQTGLNRFRVVDTTTGLASNEVRVTID